MLTRIDNLLDEIGHNDKKEKKLYEKARVIAHNLGISFWDESEDESENEDSTDN